MCPAMLVKCQMTARRNNGKLYTVPLNELRVKNKSRKFQVVRVVGTQNVRKYSLVMDLLPDGDQVTFPI